MRVQPHVWAVAEGEPSQRWMTNVIIDSVCTHGHMRGILGALFHAGCVWLALATGHAPTPTEWKELVDELEGVPEVIREHEQLDHLWLTVWERRSGLKIDEAVRETLKEIRDDIDKSLPQNSNRAGAYQDAVERTEAVRSDQRGSGTKTAVLASLAAWLFEGDPDGAIQTCVNYLGTDTDSIGTMAGAIAGATVSKTPKGQIADRAYIEREAERMWAIGDRKRVPNFPYPSLVNWTPPKTQLDSVGAHEDAMSIAGLGPAKVEQEIAGNSKDNGASWSWMELWFGQRVLAKHRPRPEPLPSSQAVEPTMRYTTVSLLDVPALETPVQRPDPVPPAQVAVRRTRTMHQITDEVIRGGFDAYQVGRALLELAERDDGIERAGEYAAIIAKANLSRRDRRQRS